ncbi:hypothetical protein [Flavobacterium cheniae]|uniref:Uncharacterized protein n=1 Tax=Flavobacterium cheniae TaxID=295428 RepID=A0A562KFC2_9FLAO|nr:hypothetical protein [Flavobacterium cheniae]TDR26111.1 hypothetical protein C8D80_0905 [Flavobacterium cheniae]TWH93965.1 hypothetical protein IP97_01913 [Flavobacterium cheniae]
MNFIKKYKLRILSVLSVLFLFLPFVKQCEMHEFALEESECFGCEIEVNYTEKISNYLSDLEIYFTEESDSIIDLSLNVNLFFEINSNDKLGFYDFLCILYILFSVILVMSSLLGVFFMFKNNKINLVRLYLLNTVLILLILLTIGYVFIDRIGQIKIGFYLLLITNFYLFYHFRKLKIDK